MKTTFSVKENKSGEFLFSAYDDGKLVFSCEHHWEKLIADMVIDARGGCTAEALEADNFGDDVSDEAEVAAMFEAWQEAAVIADEKGFYAERAGRNGKKLIQLVRWAENYQDIIDECESISEVCDTAIDLETSGSVEPLNEAGDAGFLYCIRRMCAIFAETEADDYGTLAFNIQTLGQKLSILSTFSVEFLREGDGEFEECSEDDAEKMELTYEFYSRRYRKNTSLGEEITREIPRADCWKNFHYESDGDYEFHTFYR